MFQRFQDLLKVKPEEKFAGTFEGKTELATIEEGGLLRDILFANARNRRLRSVQLIAQEARGGQEFFIQVETMINAGFPQDKPIDLHLEIEQGPDVAREDGVDRDPERNPADTKGQVMLKVYKQCMIFAQQGKQKGVELMLAEIDSAMGSSAVINHNQPQSATPAPPPNFDPPPVHGHEEDGTPRKKK